MRWPRVSVVVCTHNGALTIRDCLDGLGKLDYPSFEVIVVDDGSTDHTRDVLAQYAGRVRTIRTENGGQGHAFNVGIEKARGEFLMLLDADDLWVRQKVEVMVNFAAKHPNAAMLYHRFQNIDEHGRQTGDPQPPILINGNFEAGFLRSGGSWWSPIASVLALRTEHIRRALPLPTYAVREGADTIVTDYCALTSEIASLPDALTLRRLHGSNLYASGREDFYYRSKEIREADIRRVEWRIFSLRQLMRRLGRDFDIDVNRNEWRMINLYVLGRAPFWKLLKTCLRSPEHNIPSRLQRVRWVMLAKKINSETLN